MNTIYNIDYRCTDCLLVDFSENKYTWPGRALIKQQKKQMDLHSFHLNVYYILLQLLLTVLHSCTVSMWKDKKMQWIILQLSKRLLVNPSEWMRPVLVLFSLMFLYGPLVSNPQLAGSKHRLSAACKLETCAGPSNYEMKNHFISEDQCGNHRKQLTRLSSVSCRTEAIKAGHVCTHILFVCFLLLPKIWVGSYFPNPDVIIPEKFTQTWT